MIQGGGALEGDVAVLGLVDVTIVNIVVLEVVSAIVGTAGAATIRIRVRK